MSLFKATGRMHVHLRLVHLAHRPRSISYVAGTFVTARTLPVLRPTACRHFSLWNSSANTVKHTPTPLDGEKASAVVQSTQPAGDVAPVPLNSAVSSHLPEGNLAQTSLDTTSTLQQAASAPVDPSIALQNSAMVDAVTHAAPIQLGDFHSLGLVDFWPSGIANQLLEVFHVATGLPWFYTIILFVAGVRIAVIPASIGSLRQSARLVQINSHVTRVRSETSNATDPFSKQYHALQMKRLMAGAGVNNSLIGVNMATTLFAQLGVWFGISRLCKLPLDQLTSSGVAFLPDLIAPDLYCSMLATLCIQVAITSMKRDVSSRQLGHVLNGMQGLSATLGTYILWKQSAALTLTIIVGSTLQTVVSLVLRSPAVRRFFQIPVLKARQRIQAPPLLETFHPRTLSAWWRSEADTARAYQARWNKGRAPPPKK